MKKFIILLFLSITITLLPMQPDDLQLANPERYQQHFQLMQIVTNCKHEFHVACLQGWNGPCPLCRNEDYLN